MLLKYVPKGAINNKPALFQIMAWCPTGTKPLSEPMTADVYWCIYVSFGANGFMFLELSAQIFDEILFDLTHWSWVMHQ